MALSHKMSIPMFVIIFSLSLFMIYKESRFFSEYSTFAMGDIVQRFEALQLEAHEQELHNSNIKSTPLLHSTVEKPHDGNNNSISVLNSETERMKLYRNRYKYQSPEIFTNHSYRDEVCGLNPPYDKYFSANRTNTRSANDEDMMIYKIFFQNETNFTKKKSMIELGAFDGLTESNSRFFDICLGWETLLIEANPLKWEKLILNRPHAHRLSYAPSCSHEEELANKTLQFTHSIWTNAALESVESAYSGKNLTTYDVPCGSLTKVIKDILNGQLSFFSLDVEGAEPLIVNNIDFDTVFIEILMIETFNAFCLPGKFCQSRNDYRKRMREAGYIMFENMIKKSDIFIHPRSEYLDVARRAGYKETAWDKAKLVD